MKFRRRVRIQPSIPTASMADIAMLLLIFFMSTSIIQTHQRAAVRLPGATAGERLRSEEMIRVSEKRVLADIPPSRIVENLTPERLRETQDLIARRLAELDK